MVPPVTAGPWAPGEGAASPPLEPPPDVAPPDVPPLVVPPLGDPPEGALATVAGAPPPPAFWPPGFGAALGRAVAPLGGGAVTPGTVAPDGRLAWPGPRVAGATVAPGAAGPAVTWSRLPFFLVATSPMAATPSIKAAATTMAITWTRRSDRRRNSAPASIAEKPPARSPDGRRRDRPGGSAHSRCCPRPQVNESRPLAVEIEEGRCHVGAGGGGEPEEGLLVDRAHLDRLGVGHLLSMRAGALEPEAQPVLRDLDGDAHPRPFVGPGVTTEVDAGGVHHRARLLRKRHPRQLLEDLVEENVVDRFRLAAVHQEGDGETARGYEAKGGGVADRVPVVADYRVGGPVEQDPAEAPAPSEDVGIGDDDLLLLHGGDTLRREDGGAVRALAALEVHPAEREELTHRLAQEAGRTEGARQHPPWCHDRLRRPRWCHVPDGEAVEHHLLGQHRRAGGAERAEDVLLQGRVVGAVAHHLDQPPGEDVAAVAVREARAG